MTCIGLVVYLDFLTGIRSLQQDFYKTKDEMAETRITADYEVGGLRLVNSLFNFIKCIKKKL